MDRFLVGRHDHVVRPFYYDRVMRQFGQVQTPPQAQSSFRRLVQSAQRPGDIVQLTLEYVDESESDHSNHDQLSVSDLDDVGAIREHEEWQAVTRPTLVFLMDDPMGDVEPLPDDGDVQEDRAQETRYRITNIFTDVINDEYDEEADLDYDGQEGAKDEEQYEEEEPPLSESDGGVAEDRHEWGDS